VQRQLSPEDGLLGGRGAHCHLAGPHAKHFAPERLPWQVLRGVTRVLQLSWGMTGVMALLRELGIYRIDFQQHPGKERRLQEMLVERLLPVAPTAGGCMRESLAERIGLKESEKNWLQFEALEVQWPHGSFFQPEVLSWMPSSNEVNASFDIAGELFLGSSFSHHRLFLPLVRGPPPLRLEELGDAAEKNRDGSGPPSSGAVPLCGPLSSAGGCFLASPGLEEGQGWIDIWAFHQ
ncbi:unnamed protein product, partial [Polarella glacialis]